MERPSAYCKKKEHGIAIKVRKREKFARQRTRIPSPLHVFAKRSGISPVFAFLARSVTVRGREEGREKGRNEGREKGRKEGRDDG